MRPLAIKEIAVTTITDQAGQPQLVIIALDATGRLWSKTGLDGDWKRIDR
jgi:hypothetical protein